jgi:transcriptional regulator with XRE-family HTH domain
MGDFTDMPADYAAALGARLRAVRRQRGLSLLQVERESGGRWKGVVIGSYERGARAVTVSRLADLAEFYEVSIENLLPGDGAVVPHTGAARILRIDLQRLAALPARQAGPLARYAAMIQSQRENSDGAILTIREQDLESLAVVCDMQPGNLTELLDHWGILIADAPTVIAG